MGLAGVKWGQESKRTVRVSLTLKEKSLQRISQAWRLPLPTVNGIPHPGPEDKKRKERFLTEKGEKRTVEVTEAWTPVTGTENRE